MKFLYLFSSISSDIPLNPKDLKRPLKLDLVTEHPFLLLEDYFNAIKDFLLSDGGRPLVSSISSIVGEQIDLDDIDRIVIRSEKHGVLYHIASAEIISSYFSVKVAVSVAASGPARRFLHREYDNLKSIHERISPCDFLPRPFFKRDMVCARDGRKSIFSLMLTDWFEGFFEWHFSGAPGNDMYPCVWDVGRGYRFLSPTASFELFKQCSRILTSCYDIASSRQVYPWHHGAGDFIVKERDGTVDVRLITVRGYSPVMKAGDPGAPFSHAIALVYFFLNMTLKMRLDKLDGTGEVHWADPYCLEAATEGFFEGLAEKDARFNNDTDVPCSSLVMELERAMKKGGPNIGLTPGSNEIMAHETPLTGYIASLLCSFDRGEIKTLLNSMLEFYDKEDPTDIPVVKANLENHVDEMYNILSSLRGKKLG